MNWQAWNRILVAALVTIVGLFAGGATVLALGVFEPDPRMSQAFAFALPAISEPASLVLFGSSLWGLACLRRRTPEKGV